MTKELLNHKAKCRLCFQRISGTRNTSRITEKVQQKFFRLTNIELKSSDKFSCSICKPCIKSLNETSEFQTKMIYNQRRLYAFEGEADVPIVKAEPIESNTIELQEINIADVFPLKTEVFEDAWTGDCQSPDPEEVSSPASPACEPTEVQENETEQYMTKGPEDEVAQNCKPAKIGRMKYPLEQLFSAVEAVALGEISITEASRKFAVPKCTIKRRVQRDSFLLTDQEELQVKMYVNKRTEFGIPTSDEDIEKFILFRLLSKRRGKDRVKVKNLSGTWVPTFRKRHSDMFLLEDYIDVEFSCDICGFSAKGKKNLRLHISGHAETVLKETSLRTKQYKREDLDEALKAVESGLTISGAAKYYKMPISTLVQYIDKKKKELSGDSIEPEIFKCSFCERFFYLATSRRQHEVMDHLTPVGEYPCKVCGKVCTTEIKLKYHCRVHNENQLYKCRTCGEAFEKSSKLKIHRSTHRDVVACHICGKLEHKGYYMSCHMKTHPTVRFTCTFEGCSKAYSNKKGIDYHIENSHAPKQNVKCTKCDKAFPNPYKLNRHDERSHGEARFECKVTGCHYKSPRKDYLKLHLRNHRDIDVKLKDELIKDLAGKEESRR